MSLIKLLWCKVVGHKPSEILYSKECDGSMESYNICDRCGREVNRTTFYDCTDFTPEDLINERVVEEKPKFQVIDSAPRRFITDRCVHEYELAPFQKYKDIRVLKCKLCGKIKKENMRFKKSKKDEKKN